MKAEEVNVEIVCPKCGYKNRIRGIHPQVLKRGFNEDIGSIWGTGKYEERNAIEIKN